MKVDVEVVAIWFFVIEGIINRVDIEIGFFVIETFAGVVDVDAVEETTLLLVLINE